jgi:hypothetical protein
MASLPIREPWPTASECLACGDVIEELLARLGSLRCAVCRLQQSPLDAARVASWCGRPDDSGQIVR